MVKTATEFVACLRTGADDWMMEKKLSVGDQ
jgi:hypothetical protein